MKLLEIKIRRVREIEELDLDLGDQQLVAILGQNGAGKTTLLGSLFFCLSGTVMFAGTKDELVRDVGDGQSFVSTRFEHDDQEFVLTRGVSRSTCKLEQIEDGKAVKTVQGAAKVKDVMAGMGLTASRLNRAILPQGKAAQLFEAKRGDRMRAQREIYGLDQLDGMCDALWAPLSGLTLNEDAEIAYQQAQDGLEQAQADAKEAEQGLTAAQELRDALKSARGTLTRANQQNRAQHALVAAREELSKAGDRQEQLANQVQEVEQQLSGRREQLEQHAERATAARTTIAQAAEAEKQLAEQRQAVIDLQQLNQQIESLEAERQSLGGGQTSLADLLERREALRAAQQQFQLQNQLLSRLAEFDQQIGTEGVAGLAAARAELAQVEQDVVALEAQKRLATDAICPTCGQDLPDAAKPELTAEQASEFLEAALEAKTQAAAAVQQIVERQRLMDERQALREQNQELLDLELTDQTQVIDRLTSEIQERQAQEQKLAALATQLAEAQATRRTVEQVASRQVDQPSDEQLHQAHREVEAHERVRGEVIQLTTKSEGLCQQLADADQQLAERQATVEEFERSATDVIDPKEVEQANAVVAREDQIEADLTAAQTAAHHAQYEANRFQEDLREAAEQLSVYRAQKARFDLLTGARFMLGSEQFPAFATRYYLDVVNAQWAHEMAELGAGFTCWQDPETLDFFAQFTDTGATRPLYALSGGERQAAAVTYSVTINRLFARRLGFIAFDEPTTHVDASLRPLMVDYFRRMLSREEFAGIQIFVIDHSSEFQAVATQPLVLSKSTYTAA